MGRGVKGGGGWNQDGYEVLVVRVGGLWIEIETAFTFILNSLVLCGTLPIGRSLPVEECVIHDQFTLAHLSIGDKYERWCG